MSDTLTVKRNRKTCLEANCNLKGFHYETVEGQKVLVFKTKHGHEWHDVKLVLPNGVLELERLHSFGEKIEK